MKFNIIIQVNTPLDILTEGQKTLITSEIRKTFNNRHVLDTQTENVEIQNVNTIYYKEKQEKQHTILTGYHVKGAELVLFFDFSITKEVNKLKAMQEAAQEKGYTSKRLKLILL